MPRWKYTPEYIPGIQLVLKYFIQTASTCRHTRSTGYKSSWVLWYSNRLEFSCCFLSLSVCYCCAAVLCVYTSKYIWIRSIVSPCVLLLPLKAVHGVGAGYPSVMGIVPFWGSCSEPEDNSSLESWSCFIIKKIVGERPHYVVSY